MKRKQWGLFFAALLVISALSGCSSGQESSNSAMDMATEEAKMSEPISKDVADGEDNEDTGEAGSAESGNAAESETSASESEGSTAEVDLGDRKVIYHAQLSMEVKNFDNAIDKIEKIVKQRGGYIVQTSQYEEEKTIGGYVTIRVPQDSFSGFLDEIEAIAVKVPHREVSGSDVTEEYVDLESRLKAKKAVEERLLAFMEDAKKTEDLLKISEDLGRVQEEIEQITGRMKYLDNQVAYSTVEIDISQPVVNPGVSGENERNTLAAAWSALISSINGILNFFSGLVVFLAASLPVLAVLAVIAIPLWVWWWKKGRYHYRSKKNGSNE